MRTVAKFGLVAGIAALALLGYTTVKQALGAFAFSISRYGSPTLASGYLRIPIAVAFSNPTPVAIDLDNVHADIYIQKFGQWIRAGIIDQALSIPPGQSEQVLIPNIDYTAILGGSLTANLLALSAAYAQNQIPVKTTLTITRGSIKATRTYENRITIA